MFFLLFSSVMWKPQSNPPHIEKSMDVPNRPTELGVTPRPASRLRSADPPPSSNRQRLRICSPLNQKFCGVPVIEFKCSGKARPFQGPAFRRTLGAADAANAQSASGKIRSASDQRQNHGQQTYCPAIIGKGSEFTPRKIKNFVGPRH